MPPRLPPAILFVVPVASTLGGGLLAIHGRRWSHLLLAAGAGVLLGAALLDLLPEALALGTQAGMGAPGVLQWTLGSFLLFYWLDAELARWLPAEAAASHRVTAGRVGGALLVLHSFRDGMAIGASYAASHAAGYVVALGIGAHDFGDGLNTVLLTSGERRPGPLEYSFLAADAIAPVLGGIMAAWFFTSARDSALLLAVAAGFFLQMATGDLLPRLRRRSVLDNRWTTPAVLAGAALIYVANVLLLRSM